jgi:hypothetical protein
MDLGLSVVVVVVVVVGRYCPVVGWTLVPFLLRPLPYIEPPH